MNLLNNLPFFQLEIGGNTVAQWVFAMLVACAVFVTARIIKRAISRRLHKISERRDTPIYKAAATAADKTATTILILLALCTASLFINIPLRAADILFRFFIIALIIQIALWLSRLVPLVISARLSGRISSDSSSALGLLTFVSQLIIWVIVLLLVLENGGVDVTALVAGLGIGGIAVALAVQNVLGDLFASLSIILDKPFVVGDFITVGDQQGTVERIGIKTTRVRSLGGEQLVFSNSDLLNSRIRNFKRMYERRVVFSVVITYDTPKEKIETIPREIERLVSAFEQVRFDRSHFNLFTDSGPNIETVYFVKSPEFNVYMDIQQRINLGLLDYFEKESIKFAYPTRTVFVEGHTVQALKGDAKSGA